MTNSIRAFLNRLFFQSHIRHYKSAIRAYKASSEGSVQTTCGGPNKTEPLDLERRRQKIDRDIEELRRTSTAGDGQPDAGDDQSA